LGELLGCTALLEFEDPVEWFKQRDRIKSILPDHLKTNTTAAWLSILEPAEHLVRRCARLATPVATRRVQGARHVPDRAARNRHDVPDDALPDSHRRSAPVF